MNTHLRLILCLGLLALAALEGPRAGRLLAELARGPYGDEHPTLPAIQAARHAEPGSTAPRAATEAGDPLHGPALGPQQG